MNDKLYKHESHTIVLVTGGFDPIHSGHIELFKQARKLRGPLKERHEERKREVKEQNAAKLKQKQTH